MKLKKSIFITLVLGIIGFLPLFDLLTPGLPITHDGRDHVARIANFYQNLSEGNIIPRWAGNLNWGYGHPILMFLYPMPSYFGSFFHFFGYSFVDSVKLVFAVGFILSGITMYMWLREQNGEIPGLVGSALYLIAPYRFVDLYVRGAIGEHVAFIFPPLVLFFLLKVAKKYSHWYVLGVAASIAGLILSHNAISLMFLPIILGYIFYLVIFVTKMRRTFLLYVISALVCGFGIAAFFWLPAFVEGKYTLRDIVTAGDYASRFVSWNNFFFGPWSYGGTDFLSKQIGIVHWIIFFFAVCVLIIFFNKKKSGEYWLLLSFVVIFTLSLFIMTRESLPIWNTITLLKKFQFPWRFLSVSVFTIATVGALVFSYIPNKKHILASLACLFLLFLFNKDYWMARAYIERPESFYTSIFNSTTDTGESSPIWSVRFMEQRPKDSIEVIAGNAVIRKGERTYTQHTYTISAQERTRIRENTVYFPGWEVLVNGIRVPIEFQDPQHRGIITFYVEKGEHEVVVRFGDTKLRMLSNAISAGSLFLLFIYSILNVIGIWPNSLSFSLRSMKKKTSKRA